MLISDFSIRQPVVTIVTMVALVVFGLIALFQVKTDEFPDVQPPFVSVGLVYPGAAPDGVEREVLEPVEEAIAAHRHRLAQASSARMIEEYYKILRSGHAEKTFAALARYRLLAPPPRVRRLRSSGS